MRSLLRAFPVMLLAAALASLTLTPRTARTVPLYAARTGLMCQTCHFDPNGGGPRTEFGFAYAKNRHSIEADTTEAWKDLTLRNRVSDDFPLYFGLDQRFMLLANQQYKDTGLDRSGFFNMENAVYATFQPHARLTLSYTLAETPYAGFQTRDAYGLIALGSDHYVKVGQFRVPFGLRMDDHTVATRNSFLDFQTGQSFLPYNSRNVDRGVELGGSHGNFFGRASWTNGGAITGNVPPGPDEHPQALAAKLGYNMSGYQGGVSIYDDVWSGSGESERRTRWGYYALGHAGNVALVGEIAAGTDRHTDTLGVTRKGRLAYFAELDWAPHRAYNVRVRYDHLEMDRADDAPTRDLNTYNRYALEGEWVPVPFAELRWTFRFVDPVADRDPLGAEIPNEKQGYLQFHVVY